MKSCFDSSSWPRLGGFLVFALIGCGQSAVRTEALAPSAMAESFDDGAFGRYESRRFGFSIGLPDGRAWRIDDRTTSWLRASHEKTGSLLRARAWDESRAVSREVCLDEARKLDPSLPILEQLLEDRLQNVGETSAHIQAAVQREDDGNLRGDVLVFGVSLRRCFVLAYESRATGPSAEQILAERLAVITDAVVPSLRFSSALSISRSLPSENP